MSAWGTVVGQFPFFIVQTTKSPTLGTISEYQENFYFTGIPGQNLRPSFVMAGNLEPELRMEYIKVCQILRESTMRLFMSLFVFSIAAMTVGCSDSTSTTAFTLKKVEFAKKLGSQMEAVDPGNEFQADETIYLSAVIKGRPKGGEITCKFYYRDQFITEATFDLADVNSGVIFSIGETTNVGFNLTHEDPFPLSKNFRAELFYDDEKLGDYPFHIVPPPSATPSKLLKVDLAKNVDDNYEPIDVTDTFAAGDTVRLVIKGDVGLQTWLQVDWFVDGELSEKGTRSLTFEENAKATGFYFEFRPEGGWPAGKHEAVLTMNDEEVKRKAFTITGSTESAGEEPETEATAKPDAPVDANANSEPEKGAESITDEPQPESDK